MALGDYEYADYDRVGAVLRNGDKSQGKRFILASVLTVFILGCCSSAREIHESIDPFFKQDQLKFESYVKLNRKKLNRKIFNRAKQNKIFK